MKKTRRIFILLISLVLACAALPITSLSASYGKCGADSPADLTISSVDGKKYDYVGLISRRDKYVKYILEPSERDPEYDGMWHHRILLREYAPILDLDSVATYLDSSVRKLYFEEGDPNQMSKWINAEAEEKFREYSRTESIKSGLPQLYYFIQYAGITREQATESMKKYFSSSVLCKQYPYADWMIDALYSGDNRVMIETYLSPELVVDMETYLSGKPKFVYVYNELIDNLWEYTIFKRPDDIIKTPLETLDTWNYSDEYWYDYYSFIDYLNRERSDARDSIAMMGHLGSPEQKAELARRLAIYAERVGKSPSTGDTNGTRAAIFTSAAALAAIPAAVLTFRRKREDAEAV